MSRMRVMSGLFAAAAVGLAACGGDFTSSGDPLTQAEAEELANALAEGGFAGLGGLAAPPRANGATDKTAERVTITLNDTAPCEGGGTVVLNGSLTADVNQTTGVGTITYNYTVAPSGCEVTTEGGTVFTLTGDPNIRATGDFNWSETSLDGSLDYDGKFTWDADDGRAGACGVNLSVEYTINMTNGSGSATMTGDVCGVTVNRTISYSA